MQKYFFPLFLAPMEEVSDLSFRMICKDFGADFLISEFVSSEALIRDVEKSYRKLAFDEKERPFGIQIFGHNEYSLRKAAEKVAEKKPDFIDINWGCPVKKVVSKGAGAAILKDIPKMVACTKAVVDTVNIPVTVKTRLGWDEQDKPIVSITEQLQDVGIQAITIHGRTRSQLYSGTADWTLIGKVKTNPRILIPVIGNGDINTAEKAICYQKEFGVDGIMIGRGAIGNPWIFKEIKARLNGQILDFPSYGERVSVVLKHLTDAIQLKGERVAILEMRKHYANYFKSIPHFKECKTKLMQVVTFEECKEVLEKWGQGIIQTLP